MLLALLGARTLVATIIGAAIGIVGLHRYPLQSENVFPAMIELRSLVVFHVLAYGYVTL